MWEKATQIVEDVLNKLVKTLIFVLPLVYTAGRGVWDFFAWSVMVDAMSLVGLVGAVYFILYIWKQDVLSKLPKWLSIVWKIFAILLWCSCLLNGCWGRCPECRNMRILRAQNGEILDLTKGKTVENILPPCWQECDCTRKISFEDNKEYALSQIQKMGDYWELKRGVYAHEEWPQGDDDLDVTYDTQTHLLVIDY